MSALQTVFVRRLAGNMFSPSFTLSTFVFFTIHQKCREARGSAGSTLTYVAISGASTIKSEHEEPGLPRKIKWEQ